MNESEANLGERLGPMIIDALNKFLENEVRVGIELHGKMVRAREVFDKVARTKKKDGKAAEEIEERKREFEEANVRYVQKLIDVETKSNFELMDVFTTWMVCALTHHKRSYKVLDELQPKIKQYKKQMFKDARGKKQKEKVLLNTWLNFCSIKLTPQRRKSEQTLSKSPWQRRVLSLSFKDI